jgi:rod shape-determining protein MreC
MIRRVNIYKRFLYLFLILSIVIALLSPDFQRKPVAWLGATVGNAVYALQEGTYTVTTGISGVWNGYFNLIDVGKENTQLLKTIEQLKGEIHRLSEKAILAERLQSFLNYKDESEAALILSTVIGRKPSHWHETIIINKGTDAGVDKDMGVVTPQGIVGKVIKAWPAYAQVLLMTDRNSGIAATIQRTRDEGVVQGTEEGGVRLSYLPQFSEAKIGDVLLTSGLEGSFTKGLKIGVIESVNKKEEQQIFLRIKVMPEVNLDHLEEVFIIRQNAAPFSLDESR